MREEGKVGVGRYFLRGLRTDMAHRQTVVYKGTRESPTLEGDI